MLKNIILASAAALMIAGTTASDADAGYRRHHFGHGHIYKPYYGYSYGYVAPTCTWKKVWYYGSYHWKRFCW
jgi:hypothetical protein